MNPWRQEPKTSRKYEKRVRPSSFINLCNSSGESGLAVVHVPDGPDVTVGLVSLEHLFLQNLGGSGELPPASERQQLRGRDRRPQSS